MLSVELRVTQLKHRRNSLLSLVTFKQLGGGIKDIGRQNLYASADFQVLAVLIAIEAARFAASEVLRSKICILLLSTGHQVLVAGRHSLSVVTICLEDVINGPGA